MSWSDETLMAFADGELDPEQRSEIERALATDAVLRRHVMMMKVQRDRLAAAFAPVLDEPMPDRLSRLLQVPSAPPAVVNLNVVRAQRERGRRIPSWAQWGGMAAGVLLGMLLGMQFDRAAADPAIGLRDGQLVAGGAVGQALSTQLASEPAAGAPVAVQLSFVDKGGNYCRTFSTGAVAGLACQTAGRWIVQDLASAETAPAGQVRQAATALPQAVLDAVDRRIAGSALDAARERRARERGWRR